MANGAWHTTLGEIYKGITLCNGEYSVHPLVQHRHWGSSAITADNAVARVGRVPEQAAPVPAEPNYRGLRLDAMVNLVVLPAGKTPRERV